MAKTDPAFLALLTDFERGQYAAFLQVRSFIAYYGKKEVDAFCMQAIADMRSDAEHADRQRRAASDSQGTKPLQSNTLKGASGG